MRNLLMFCSLAVLLLAACGDSTTTNKAANPAANPAVDTAGSSTSPEAVIKETAQNRNAVIEMSKLAQSKAGNTELKQFAQTMVTDHTAGGKDLEELAKKKSVTLPTDTGSFQPMIGKLGGQSGEGFDRYYMEQIAQVHESDMTTLRKQTESSSDADVKAYAAKALPVIQKHLDAIKALKAKMK